MKKIVAVAMTAIMIVGLCGCSSKDYSDTKLLDGDVIRVGVDTSLEGEGLYNDYYENVAKTYDNIEFVELSREEQIEQYLQGEIDVAWNLPLNEKKEILEGNEVEPIDLGMYVGIRINPQADSFSDIESMENLYKGISLCLDRVYGQERVEGIGNSPVASTYLGENGYDAKESGVLNIEDGIDLLETCGYEFEIAGDGTYNTNPEIEIPFEVLRGDAEAYALAEVVQSDLDVIGITIIIEEYDLEEYNKLLENNEYHIIASCDVTEDETSGFIPLWEKTFVTLQKENVEMEYSVSDKTLVLEKGTKQ